MSVGKQYVKGTAFRLCAPSSVICFFSFKEKRGKGEKGEREGEREGGIWVRESVWGTRGRKERSACKDAIVFSVLYAQILSVKIVIGQN